jgi:2-dehydropantoate 2-reductase
MTLQNATPATRCAIVGAGAIGAWLADALDRAGWNVSLVARGETLAALRADGLIVEQGGVSRRSHPGAGAPAELGVQDVVFLTVKAQALPGLAAQLAPLFDERTVAISGTNGIPWWFFHDFLGPLNNHTLQSVDPGGTIAQALPSDRVLGSVVHASVTVTAPGRVRVVGADRLLLGEPDGSSTARVQHVVAALAAGGIKAQASPRIRHEIWAKLWGNMNMNPLSALTRSGTGTMLADPDVRDLCLRMMEEMQHCGERLNLSSKVTALERIAVTGRLGNFRTSMLADLEAGRDLEYAPQLGAVVEIAERLDVPTPNCRAVLGLIRLLSAARTT